MASQHDTRVSATPHRLAIVGASGYVGQVLHAMAMHHPCISAHIPQARTPQDLTDDMRNSLRGCAAVALALPRAPALAWTRALLDLGITKILDLSDAHRLPRGQKNSPNAHYGIPELMGAPPPDTAIVANPGCYPTATLLALHPLMTAGAIEPDGICVLGTSGASGAGKGVADHLHFCNLSENSFPYKVGEHRHIPEIEAHLGAQINFVPQLLPIVRGMLVTSFVRPRVSPAEILEILVDAYADAPWVSVLPEPGQGLGLRHVIGTHQALIAVGPVAGGGMLPVFGTIDNLMRGAASQALHNLNLWLGLEAGLGLPRPLGTLPYSTPPCFAHHGNYPPQLSGPQRPTDTP